MRMDERMGDRHLDDHMDDRHLDDHMDDCRLDDHVDDCRLDDHVDDRRLDDHVDDRLASAVEFFRKEKGLHRLIDQVIEKYRRTGDIRGKVRLDRLDDAERVALSELFRTDYSARDSVAIPARRIAEALERTRFAGIELVDILDGYQGGPIRTLAEEHDQRQAAKNAFFQSLHDACKSPYGRAWLDNVAAKGPGNRGIHRSYDRDPAALRAQLEMVLRVLADLPADPARPGAGRYERLPVFASRISGDPHGFDIDTEQGKHLIAALSWVRAAESRTAPLASPLEAEDITGLLAYFGIFRDDLLNFVTCTGILAFGNSDGATPDAAACAVPDAARDTTLGATLDTARDTAPDATPDAARDTVLGATSSAVQPRPLATWAAACQEGVVLNVPLRELVKVQSCQPFEACTGPDADCAASPGARAGRAVHVGQAARVGKAVHAGQPTSAGPAVFVIENSGVFSAVLDEVLDQTSDQVSDRPALHIRRPPMVCTHGQFKLAAWIILGKLAAGGATLFYSGDFDPEGLQMAQKLMDRFPGSVRPWRYGLQDYRHCMPGTPLPAGRLAKLKAITAPELLLAKEGILAEEKAGYQERLIDALAADILEALCRHL